MAVIMAFRCKAVILIFYRYGWLLQTLSLNERRVAKVVPDRITSLAFHPLSASPIVAAGDKWGRLGIWQVVRVGIPYLIIKPNNSLLI